MGGSTSLNKFGFLSDRKNTVEIVILMPFIAYVLNVRILIRNSFLFSIVLGIQCKFFINHTYGY